MYYIEQLQTGSALKRSYSGVVKYTSTTFTNHSPAVVTRKKCCYSEYKNKGG